MCHNSVSSESLTWPMAAATRVVPLDAAPRGTLLEHYLNVHAIDGVKPGKYRWISGGVASVGDVESPRKEGATLCFGQPLGGDSAYTVFHSALLDSLLDNLGSRGYRAAQLEAGIVSGRLALSAFALGLGATGLTFFDDLVSAYFPHIVGAHVGDGSWGVRHPSSTSRSAGPTGDPRPLPRADGSGLLPDPAVTSVSRRQDSLRSDGAVGPTMMARARQGRQQSCPME